jgi:hypothetical protein
VNSFVPAGSTCGSSFHPAVEPAAFCRVDPAALAGGLPEAPSAVAAVPRTDADAQRAALNSASGSAATANRLHPIVVLRRAIEPSSSRKRRESGRAR